MRECLRRAPPRCAASQHCRSRYARDDDRNFTSLPNFAQHLVAAGADGLVLFNRYAEADIDLDTLQIKPDLVLIRRIDNNAGCIVRPIVSKTIVTGPSPTVSPVVGAPQHTPVGMARLYQGIHHLRITLRNGDTDFS